MKIKKVVNKNLRSIVSFEIADGRIFGATGRRIIELDSDLNRVSEYNGFYYTYSVKLSPDKRKLLCASQGNIFYIIDLKTGEVKKNILRGKYRGNLEGRGCWSSDGKYIYLPVWSSKDFFCALRKYSVKDGKFEDLFADRWKIFDFIYVESLKKILMFVSEKNGKCSFVWFDEQTESVHEIKLPEGIDVFPSDMVVNEKEKTITCYCLLGDPVVFDFNGKAIGGFVEIRKKKRTLPYPNIKPIDTDSEDIAEVKRIFEEIKEEWKTAESLSETEPEDEQQLSETVQTLMSEEFELPESIISSLDDEEDGLFFVGTCMRLMVWNRNNREDCAELPVEFGVKKIRRLGKNKVLAECMHSVILCEVTREKEKEVLK